MTTSPKHRAAEKGLLQAKLAANYQRNLRHEYLVSLPSGLGAFLAECSFVQSPELDVIHSVFMALPDGSGHQAHQAKDYTFREFGWRDKVLRAAQELKFRQSLEPAYFWPGYDNPIYCVPFQWVKDNLEALFLWEIGVVAQDYSAGIVISHYCGYFQEDYNPEEVVYELASWGQVEP